MGSLTCKRLVLVVVALFMRTAWLPSFFGFVGIEPKSVEFIQTRHLSADSDSGIRKDKFLEVPQIVRGLNDQKIAFARACLTARLLNRTRTIHCTASMKTWYVSFYHLTFVMPPLLESSRYDRALEERTLASLSLERLTKTSVSAWDKEVIGPLQNHGDELISVFTRNLKLQ
ncbi:hypothetical protein KPL70_004721 [Citrus sinensis]|nr:hypothetical protein KPL70_004718 [Citrus sinensis]KAH9747459.1 hypothetical protein KPL70_004718 [Citrus sinensis]KAH9747462.1 hypothetical protein KPL70_004721 [Citrus sinensis]KAH9747463.1 hypothetical protein KPL70_004721 [Citrus sinensis]